MSSVNFLEKLLDGVALQWKPLGELANLITKGTTPKSYSDSGVNYIKVENIINSSISLEKKVFIYKDTHENELKRSIIELDDILFSIAGSIGRCAIASKEILPANINQAIAIIRLKKNINLNIKYIFYILQSKSMFEYIEKFNKTSAQPNLNLKQVSDFSIPIPCPDNPKKSLEIQAEIVRILDAMTAHTAELTAELTARKKQYTYYRDKLLSFEDGEVEWLDLDTLAKIKTGQSVNKKMISDNPGEYAVINSGREPLGFIDVWNTDNDPIGITSRGAGVGSITWREGKYFRGNLNYSVTIKNKEKINIRYLYHILQKMQLEIQALCTFDGIPALNASNLKELEIPVPLLDDQNRIVAILDKFDALTASITEGLPREIELRQKQYAYYRDLLLSFPQAQAA